MNTYLTNVIVEIIFCDIKIMLRILMNFSFSFQNILETETEKEVSKLNSQKQFKIPIIPTIIVKYNFEVFAGFFGLFLWFFLFLFFH